MLPKKNRISRKDFPVRNRRGFRVFSPFFSGTIYGNKGAVKVSVVVSKKTAKTAVARNYLRKIFYAAADEYTKSFLNGALIVFYPKIEAQKTSFAFLKSEIKKVFRQGKIIP